MKHIVASLFVLTLLIYGTAAAQEPAPEPALAQSPEAAARARITSVDPVNVRYQVAIRDEGGPQPGTKVVSMLGTLAQVSSVRAQGSLPGRRANPLNVDVLATEVRDQKILTRLSIEYVPEGPQSDPISPLSVRQTVYVWLDNGKPMVVSESTDPNSDRRLTVEVTATILK